MDVNTDCVVESTIFACYNRWKVPQLFRFADQGHWDRIPARAKRRPAEARFVHRYAPADTALHRLVRPLEGTPCLSDANSYGPASTELSFRDIHSDCAGITDLLLEATHAILTVHPDAASATNCLGQTPLHVACKGRATLARLAAAQLLLTHTPMAARWKDKQGNTPHHIFLMANPWIEDKKTCDPSSSVVTVAAVQLRDRLVEVVSEFN